MSNDDFTSVLDKTDWKKVIQKSLAEAVLSLGSDEEFWYNCEQAIQAMSAVFPNWDASTEIQKMVNETVSKHNKKAEFLLLNNRDMAYQFASPWNKDAMLRTWKNAMYKEILQNLEDIAGRHRMLLYGKKNTVKGEQMDLPGDDGE